MKGWWYLLLTSKLLNSYQSCTRQITELSQPWRQGASQGQCVGMTVRFLKHLMVCSFPRSPCKCKSIYWEQLCWNHYSGDLCWKAELKTWRKRVDVKLTGLCPSPREYHILDLSEYSTPQVKITKLFQSFFVHWESVLHHGSWSEIDDFFRFLRSSCLK